MLRTSTTQIKQIILIQFVASLLAALLVWLFDQTYAISALAGGLTASIANGYFGWKVFGKQQEVAENQILSTYYKAEVGKIILTVSMFVVVFNVIKPLSVVALMCAYLLITMIPWLVSFFINTDKEDASKNWREKNVE